MDRPLRVVMPALTYVPGAMGGSETYVRALVVGLDARDDVDLTVIVSKAAAGALGARSEHVVSRISGGSTVISRLRTIVRGAVADRETRALLKDADVVHYPFTVPVPLPPRRVPWMITLLDVQHRDLPGMFSRAERLFRAVAYDAPARHASRVITISAFCRDQIHARLGVPAARIDVAHLGVDLDRFSFHDGPRESFVFYPATAWPHKNHEGLIVAMELIRRERPDLRLVLTGGLRERLGPLPAWAEHRGQVPEDELSTLYRSAACLAFPSLYEGFGLPPLEAMASGCPVAASRCGSLPEICGGAAILFDANDASDVASAIARAIDDGDRLARAGVGRSTLYGWDACARAHVSAYLLASARA